MAKEDLRVVKTKQLIKGAFLQLVEEKGYTRVSVSDITTRAEINRNTFYLHYADKDDLVKKIIKEKADKISELFIKSRIRKNSLYDISEIELKWGVRRIFKEIEPEQEMFRIVLLDSALSSYINGLSEILKKEIAKILNVQNPRSNLVYEYAFSGMFGIIKQWIMYSPASINETVSIFTRLAYVNLQQFKDIN